MIKLERVRAQNTVTAGLRGAKLREKNLKLLKLKRELADIPSKKFNSDFWKQAKPQLKVETHNKCAYCEADTAVVAHGDVEHFRPKNRYWWIVYCYDNYLYSCQLCNQTFKSNNFPLSGPKIRSPIIRSNSTDDRLKEMSKSLTVDPLDVNRDPTMDSFVVDCLAEKPDLIDPYIQDPEGILTWEVDRDLGEVTVTVKDGVERADAIKSALERFLGLNREELRRLRFRRFRVLELLKKALEQNDDSDLANDITNQLKTMIGANEPFAGMTRYFVNIEWELGIGTGD